MQHIWAEIEHDIGYKSTYGVPRDIRRTFSKVASLLEVADDEFLIIRDEMSGYVNDINSKIDNGQCKDVVMNGYSLPRYLEKSTKMNSLMQRIISIENAEVMNIKCDSYIPQLEWLGKKNAWRY